MKIHKYLVCHNKDCSVRHEYQSFLRMVWGIIRWDIYYYYKRIFLKQTDRITNRHWVHKNGKLKLHLFCYKGHSK